MFDAATSWILDYWTTRLGREPSDDEIEPLTRAFWTSGREVRAATYLSAIETLQRFARRVAAFLLDVDVFLSPAVSAPPLPLGLMVSTPEDPYAGLEESSKTTGYSLLIANLTGNPAMSVPLHWTSDGLPIGMHFLGRYGDEATLFRLAGQLERARPWADRHPAVFAS